MLAASAVWIKHASRAESAFGAGKFLLVYAQTIIGFDSFLSGQKKFVPKLSLKHPCHL
jgi:hypothetical protein